MKTTRFCSTQDNLQIQLIFSYCILSIYPISTQVAFFHIRGDCCDSWSKILSISPHNLFNPLRNHSSHHYMFGSIVVFEISYLPRWISLYSLLAAHSAQSDFVCWTIFLQSCLSSSHCVVLICSFAFSFQNIKYLNFSMLDLFDFIYVLISLGHFLPRVFHCLSFQLIVVLISWLYILR